MVKEDYIMRLIHEVVRTLLKLLFQIDEEKEEEFEFADTETEAMYRRLKRMAREGQINEAENRLSEVMDREQKDGFAMAILFYDYLNTFEEEELEQAGFSREEIQEGILAAARLYGYDGMVSALLEQ